jgi:hypothetical protein
MLAIKKKAENSKGKKYDLYQLNMDTTIFPILQI